MTNTCVADEVMTYEKATEIIQFVLSVGEYLQINGGEISRVEDTIQRICTAYGAERTDVFSITSVTFVTAIWKGGIVVTQSRRVRGVEKNTYCLEAINALSREICQNPIPIDEAREKLSVALKRKHGSKKRFLVGSLLATTSYAAFFGGDWKDILVTFAVTFVIVLCQLGSNYLGGNRILANVLCCFCAGLAATLIGQWWGSSLTMVMSGCIMVLIPGISLTSAIENLILGDTLSGIMGAMEAVITALALAGGFALSQMLLGGIAL